MIENEQNNKKWAFIFKCESDYTVMQAVMKSDIVVFIELDLDIYINFLEMTALSAIVSCASVDSRIDSNQFGIVICTLILFEKWTTRKIDPIIHKVQILESTYIWLSYCTRLERTLVKPRSTGDIQSFSILDRNWFLIEKKSNTIPKFILIILCQYDRG